VRLAVDLDGVVLDFTGAMNRWALEHYQQKLVEPTHWDWFKSWREPYDFTRTMDDREFWATIEPYPDAIDGLLRLHKAGHDITFITHRPMVADAATEMALSYWELWHPLVMTSGNKSKEALEHGINWAIDDLPSTVRLYRGAGITAYLMDRPWNQEATDLPRLYGWDDIIRQVEEDSKCSAATSLKTGS
jgi:hypothetical protein